MYYRAVVVKNNPWQRVAAAVVAVLLVLLAALIWSQTFSDFALAKDTKCEDNHDCFMAKQKQSGTEACRHNIGNGWEWMLDKNGEKIPCEKEEKEEPTKTLQPIIITYTPVPKVDPTKTQKPPKPPATQVVVEPSSTLFQPESGGGASKQPTPTCTPTLQAQTASTPSCDWCQIIIDINRIANAQETQTAWMIRP